jgi:hypothetical protein
MQLCRQRPKVATRMVSVVWMFVQSDIPAHMAAVPAIGHDSKRVERGIARRTRSFRERPKKMSAECGADNHT